MVMAVQPETADATWLKEVTVHEVPRFSAGAAMAPRAVRSVRPAEASIFAGDCRERLGWGQGEREREKRKKKRLVRKGSTHVLLDLYAAVGSADAPPARATPSTVVPQTYVAHGDA
jgi:hypothetical protein